MFRNKEDSHEFKPLLVEIEEEPLNPLGRTIFWVIILAILFFALWMTFGKVDVVVTARGKVIPVGEVKTVQPLNTGVVKNILVKPGDFVETGQVLMEIDPSDIEPELASMQTDLKQVELEVLRLESLLNGTPFTLPAGQYDARLIQVQKDIYCSTKERLDKQIRVKQEELAQLAERLGSERKAYQQAEFLCQLSNERYQRLSEVKEIIRRDDFDQAVSDLKTYANQMKTTAHRIEELRASQQRVHREIDYIKEDERNRLLNELAEKGQKCLYLNAKIEKAQFINTRQQITSPVAGHVAQLLVHTIGGVVTPAEKLAHIVPTGFPLVVKAFVLNQDVGFVAAGMEASLKLDAFNFQKYGVLNGEVLQVSKDSIEDKNLGLVYEIYIRPRQAHLMVEGAATPITTGMSVTAEIKVGQRRIIEFFIYPLIKYLDEGLSVK